MKCYRNREQNIFSKIPNYLSKFMGHNHVTIYTLYMSLSFAKRLIVGAYPNTHKTHQDGLLIFILSIQSYQHKLYLEKV